MLEIVALHYVALRYFELHLINLDPYTFEL